MLTVFSPIYKPRKLAKFLNTISNQSYRPIKFVLALDAPKSTIEYNSKKYNKDIKIIKNFIKRKTKKNFQIQLKIRKKNLTSNGNARKFIFEEKIKTKYILFYSQNDFLIEKNFLKDSINFLENNKDCSIALSVADENDLKKNKKNLFWKTKIKGFHKFNGIMFLKYFKFLNFLHNDSTTIYNWENIKKNGYYKFFPNKKIYQKFGIFWEDLETFYYFSLINKNLAFRYKICAETINYKDRSTKVSEYTPGVRYHNKSAVFLYCLLYKNKKFIKLKKSILLILLFHFRYKFEYIFNDINKYFGTNFLIKNIISLTSKKIFGNKPYYWIKNHYSQKFKKINSTFFIK